MRTHSIPYVEILGISKTLEPQLYKAIKRCANGVEVVSTLAKASFRTQLESLESRRPDLATHLIETVRLFQQKDPLFNAEQVENELKWLEFMEKVRRTAPEGYQTLFQGLKKDEENLNSIILLAELQWAHLTLKKQMEAWFLTFERPQELSAESLQSLLGIAKGARLEKLEALTSFILDGENLFGFRKLSYTNDIHFNTYNHINRWARFPLLFCPLSLSQEVVDLFKKHGIATSVTPPYPGTESTFETKNKGERDDCQVSIEIPWQGQTQNPVVALMRQVYLDFFLDQVQTILKKSENAVHFKAFQKVACHQYIANPLPDGFFEYIHRKFHDHGIEVDRFPEDGKGEKTCLTFSKPNPNWDPVREYPTILLPPQACPGKVLSGQPEGSWMLQPSHVMRPEYALYIKSSGIHPKRQPVRLCQLQGKTTAEIMNLIRNLVT